MMDFDKINAYITALYEGGHKLSKQNYIENTEAKAFVPVVDDDVARVLKLLIRIARPQKILEIGTSIGYSTVSMAMAAKEYGGRIVTVEYDKDIAGHAAKNFKRAGVSDLIEIICGDAAKVVPDFKEQFDFIFLDVDKGLYPVLFTDCLKILKQGGLFVAEDVLFPAIDLEVRWNHLIAPVAEFNRMAMGSELLESAILPVGDGLLTAIKK